jgi:type IV secretory pathway TrbF-like protein
MRCPKCKRNIGLINKYCPNCGTAAPKAPPGQRKKRVIIFLIWLLVFILLIPIIYYFASHASNAQNYTSKDNFLGAMIVAFFSACALYLIYKLIRFSIRRPIWGIPILVIFVVIPAAILSVFFYPSYTQNKALSGIQNNLADITSAKLLGNSVMNKKSDFSFDSVQSSIAAASEKLINLSVPDALKNYQAAAILWSVRIASAAGQAADWKKLKNQPDAFPLILTDNNAGSYFSASIKIVEDLKKSGEDAIKNKDYEAMRQIAAKLLVQEHWLNAILYSQKENTVGFLTTSAFAASQNLPVPPVGQGVDVTCSVCDYPDAYKVHWTEKLRQQYGCDTRCRPKTTSTQGQTVTEEQTKAKDEAAKYADALAVYTYKDVPKRAICIGNNVGGVFCVEEAVQSTNEIAASAMGFANNTKALTVGEWNNEYQDIDLAVLPADTTGEAPSTPSANDGHKEGGMGTISTGEPDKAPAPAQKKGGIWDGTYDLQGTCLDTRHSDYYSWSTADKDQFTVENNVINPIPSDYITDSTFNANIAIDANGHAVEKSDRTAPDDAHISETREFQFTQAGSGASVQERDVINFTNLSDPWDSDCTLTGARR